MPPLCLDHLSLVDLTALELIQVAADLECANVSLFVTPVPLGPALDLTTDSAARSKVLNALKDYGIGVGLIEPFMLEEATDWPLLESSAELAAELGASINALGFDTEPMRLRDSLGRLAELAIAFGVPMTIEAYPASAIRTQSEALALACAIGPGVGLCVDTLHVMRAGGSWDDVAALPAERVRHVQLSDGPRCAPADRYEEAVFGRLPPGDGEFDLAKLLPRLPHNAALAVEAPFRARPGLSPLERGRILIEATRRLFEPQSR